MKIIILLISFMCTDARAQTPAPSPEPTIRHEQTFTVGPGIEWGENSQTFELLVGGFGTEHFDGFAEDDGTKWNGAYLKGGLTRHDNQTVAYNVFITFFGGGHRLNWWPAHFEISFGVDRKDGQGFGVIQLGYLVGKQDSLQFGVLTQAPVYTATKPSWFSDFQFALRWPFPVKKSPETTFVQKP